MNIFLTLFILIGTSGSLWASKHPSLLDLKKQMGSSDPISRKTNPPAAGETAQVANSGTQKDEDLWKDLYGIRCNPSLGDCLKNSPNYGGYRVQVRTDY